MAMNSTYFRGFCCPALDEYQFGIHEDIGVIQRVVRSWLDDRKRIRRERRSRDKLAYQLEDLQDKIQKSLYDRENESSSPDPEMMSLEEKMLYFLDWRNQLQILHTSIGRSLGIARRLRTVYTRAEVQSLQDIHDELTDHLYETDYLQQKAREKLEEIRNTPQMRHSGHDSGYQSPRVGPPSLRNHSNKYLIDVLEDAEKIKAESIEASLRMENEVERLKAKSIDMAKDLVALNKVIESQKKELVELTRMKRNHEMTEKELELDEYTY